MASSNHAKFDAFITKVNNSAIFWMITAVLKMSFHLLLLKVNLKPHVKLLTPLHTLLNL